MNMTDTNYEHPVGYALVSNAELDRLRAIEKTARAFLHHWTIGWQDIFPSDRWYLDLENGNGISVERYGRALQRALNKERQP